MTRREAIAALIALPPLTRISVDKVQPNDVIVVECAHLLTQNATMLLRAQLEGVWPTHRIVVLTPMLKLRVVSENNV